MTAVNDSGITATYRLQLHEQYTLGQLEELIDYLYQLGISTVYAAPLFRAVPGSLHGYDVTDPHVLNPAIGTPEQLTALAGKLREHQMNWLQDIVPNHMAFHGDNYRLMDVLERGPASQYYRFFDIDWEHPHPSLHGKLMVPFLGKELEDCVKDHSIRLLITDRGPGIHYGERSYPLSLSAYPFLMDAIQAEEDAGPMHSWLQELMRQASLHPTVLGWQQFKAKKYEQLISITSDGRVKRLTNIVNSHPPMLLQLLQRQYYRLAFYREASERINYRRFFTVNELICLRMEDEAVFNSYHRFIDALYKRGLIQGLRIDHIDGLQDPAQYIERLRKLVGKDTYIVAEKILEVGELLPADWQLQGSSGYEFLSHLNRLFTDTAGWELLHTFYGQLVPDIPSYEALVQEKKKHILTHYMQGEWDNLTGLFYALPGMPSSISRQQVKETLAAFMLLLPVYRLYPQTGSLSAYERQILEGTFAAAHGQYPALEQPLRFLRDLWEGKTSTPSKQRIGFLQRLMQFTGPLTAKGVEDTSFYVYNALLSHNEVGDDPSAGPLTAEAFHQLMEQRQATTPLSLNGSTTHDTKRGEDGRLRLNLLSLFPTEWQELVSTAGDGTDGPGINDAYFIYQSIVAGYPSDGVISTEFLQRLDDYLRKALREAKVQTSWEQPNDGYEATCIAFARQLLSEKHPFRLHLRSFMARLDSYLPIYTPAQVLLKITAPGIPDIYQGCELWDFSYVDPDNRRPVDYTIRREWLSTLKKLDQEGGTALLDWIDEQAIKGAGKLFTVWKGLQCRRNNPALFAQGDYIRVYTDGPAPLIAFLRRHENDWILVVVPLLHRDIVRIGHSLWKGVHLLLPTEIGGIGYDQFTGEKYTIEEKLAVAQLFEKFPVALIGNKSILGGMNTAL